VDLLPAGHTLRLDILPSLVRLAIYVARFSAADELIAELAASDDPASQAYALLFRAERQMTQGGLEDLESVRADVDRAAKMLTEIGDERGMAVAERMLGATFWMECRAEAATAAYTRARDHAERAGDTALTNEMTTQMGAAAIFGPTPVEEALARAEQRLAAGAGKPIVEAQAKRGLGRLLALVGEFERARALHDEGSETMRQAGLGDATIGGLQGRAFIERLAGNQEAAADFLRQGAATLKRLEDRRYLSTMALNLVLVLLDLEQVDEAKMWLEEAIAAMNPADVVDAAFSHAAQGRIAAVRGDYAEGIERTERAVELAESTDFSDIRTATNVQHAQVLALAGRKDEAAAAYERALAITRAKGATAWTKQIEALLAEL
jgi:tetratricopeptide (TPR) repeat protein